jgi:hypothetical protein
VAFQPTIRTVRTASLKSGEHASTSVRSVDRAGEGEKAIRRQELQMRVRKRVETIHLAAGTRESDAVSRVKMRIDMPFDQPGQGEEGGGG